MNTRTGFAFFIVLGTAMDDLHAQRTSDRSPVQRPRSSLRTSAVADVPDDLQRRYPASFPSEFRTVNGSGNNVDHRHWGAAETTFLRLVRTDYADGRSAPGGEDRPSPRWISNIVASQSESSVNSRGASDFVWMWGQFIDHDLTETPVADPAESFDIEVPVDDPWFDPYGLGNQSIPLDRSGYDVVDRVRQQVNLLTAFLDASHVYGSDYERAMELRTLDGTGRMKTSANDLLPFNVNAFPNAPSSGDPSLFLAGDIRANEQVALTAMHTLFVREHNHWAQVLGGLGVLDGESIYQIARAMVGAEIQAITYREFLPVLLGADAMAPYEGYDSRVDPSISNIFGAAAFRVGHTMLSSQLLRVMADGSTHPSGHISLSDAFFSPDEIISVGIDPYLRGLSRQVAQEVDPYVIDDVRNFLFGPPGAGGFDLASLNIQRGRDHGIPSYNDVREELGLRRASSVLDVSSDAEIQSRLSIAYDGVDRMDAWVGLLSEDHVEAALVGPTLRAIISEQFERLRAGDRFWYQSYLPGGVVPFVEDQTLAAIIRRNTGIGNEIPDDVFHARP